MFLIIFFHLTSMTDQTLKRNIRLPCLILKLAMWLMWLSLKTEHLPDVTEPETEHVTAVTESKTVYLTTVTESKTEYLTKATEPENLNIWLMGLSLKRNIWLPWMSLKLDIKYLCLNPVIYFAYWLIQIKCLFPTPPLAQLRARKIGTIHTKSWGWLGPEVRGDALLITLETGKRRQ